MFELSETRFTLRSALEGALKSGDWRLDRNPFHFAAVLHSNRSRTWHALCNVVDRLGLDLADFIDVPDKFGEQSSKRAIERVNGGRNDYNTWCIGLHLQYLGAVRCVVRVTSSSR